MPRHFTQEPDSNNYKLLSIIAENSVENQVVYDTILNFWDVDQAEGVALDRLGKDEGISRGGWNDDDYRKMIKIQYIMNLSEGDIPTMNLILAAYMGDGFLGLHDMWKREPASMSANFQFDYEGNIPKELLQKIKAAGVRAYWSTTGSFIDDWYIHNEIFLKKKLTPETTWFGGRYNQSLGTLIDGTWRINGSYLLNPSFVIEEDTINQVSYRQIQSVDKVFNEFEENLALLITGDWTLDSTHTLDNPPKLVKLRPIQHDVAIFERKIYERVIDGTWYLDGSLTVGVQRLMNGTWDMDGEYLMDGDRTTTL